jgi:hypothetical protein
MSFKTKLSARVVQDIDKTHQEQIIFQPMSNGKKDPGRDTQEIFGVPSFEDGSSNRLGGGKSRDWSASITGQVIIVRVDRHRYPDINMRTKDLMKLAERNQPAWMEVQSAYPMGGRWIIEAVAIK